MDASDFDSAYKKGREEGYSEGYDDGYEVGFEEGKCEPEEELLNEYKAGYHEGYGDGAREADEALALYNLLSVFLIMNPCEYSQKLLEFLRNAPKVDNDLLPHPASIRKI